jgi:alkylation response protein AidB-like acyl-CoA dehydrogenase
MTTETNVPAQASDEPMRLTHNSRGFALIPFTDRYGVACTIQKSSLATEDAIWFGVHESEPKIMASQAAAYGVPSGDGTGWVPFPVPDAVSMNTRMHLTQDQVRELLPILAHFAETGELDIATPRATADVEKLRDLSARLREHNDPRLYHKADILMSEAADAIDAAIAATKGARHE